METLRLRWLGAAGFRVEAGAISLLIDPYISRNTDAHPPYVCSAKELFPAQTLLLSHGHFDHAADVPGLVGQGIKRICCDRVVARNLVSKGVPAEVMDLLFEGWQRTLYTLRVRAFPIRHVRYGARLVLRALRRMGPAAGRYVPLARDWPCGQPYAFRLDTEGPSIVHMGTSGATLAQIERIAASGPVDLLLVALQGNARIHDIASAIVARLKPRYAVPIHQDDFFPPISEDVPVGPFEALVRERSPDTRVVTIAPGGILELPKSAGQAPNARSRTT
jgi:L-ascorbate metabolism protein UlaG (beta-lactamase superfamily)